MLPRMADLGQVQTDLLAWYAANGRDLPWRKTRDPYAILVSEVMLQQTQVDRVIPYWHAWLEHFPTLADLAASSRADAIRAWQGLGYNLRAVRLHTIARHAVAEHAGQLPRTLAGLMMLTGIGRYTAGAVACFAYGEPIAVVDTNVRRVLRRVFGLEDGAVQAVADQAVPTEGAYAWNQALMDLGATICRTRKPMCLVCPLLSQCGGPQLRSRMRKPSERFADSRRFFRGRLVSHLIRSSDVSFVEACRVVDDRRDIIDDLASDGVIRVENGRVSLAE
jgi:A/G-specific adenine glycosylase